MIPILLIENWGTVKKHVMLLKSVGRVGIAHGVVEFRSSIRWQKNKQNGI